MPLTLWPPCSAACMKPDPCIAALLLSQLSKKCFPFLSPIQGSLINSWLGASLPCDWAMFSCLSQIHWHTQTPSSFCDNICHLLRSPLKTSPDWFHVPYSEFPVRTTQTWSVRCNYWVRVHLIRWMTASADSHTLAAAAQSWLLDKCGLTVSNTLMGDLCIIS